MRAVLFRTGKSQSRSPHAQQSSILKAIEGADKKRKARADLLNTERPITDNVTVLVGLIPLLLGVVLCTRITFGSDVAGALFLAGCYAVPLIVYELLVRQSHRNTSTGLDWTSERGAEPTRVALKLIGLLSILLAVALVHTVFRIYTPLQLKAPLVAAVMVAPTALAAVALYFWVVDRRMRQPKDGYWELGAWLCGRNPAPDTAILKDFVLGWAIKGFFLPIMFTYLADGVGFMQSQIALLSGGPVEVASYLIRVALVLELTIVVVGYTMTARLFDAHIRSPNRYLAAWVVTLICYQPLNLIVFGQVLPFRGEKDWSTVIGDYPSLMGPWLVLLLGSFAFYVWATAIYGLRWSNLTHRGIITTGPYRYMKHPDYVAKSAYFWLTAAPFLTAATPWGAVTGSLALLAVNAIYYGRARMEEKHLSEDPAYVAYALEMNDRSIFRGVARIFPMLRYRAPGSTWTEPSAPDGSLTVTK